MQAHVCGKVGGMDPNAALAKMLSRAEKILAADDAGEDVPAEAVELAELILGLHEWLKKDGFLPARWRGSPKTPAARRR